MSQNIYQKIAAVMAEENYMKRGSAGQGTGVLYDELIVDLKPKLVKHGIVVLVDLISDNSRQNQKGNYIYEGFFAVHYVSVDDGSKHTSHVTAHSMDSGDKAPGKAITYATKISHLKVFAYETGSDEESRAEEKNTDFIDEAQYSKLFAALCDQNGVFTPRGEKIRKAFNIQDLRTVSLVKYTQIMQKVK